MLILSIDVGIKNLAYCLFFLEDENKYSILEWDVLDLTKSEKKYCQGNNEKQNCICKNKAKYHKNNQYFCKIHAKNSNDFIIPNNDINLPKLNKCKYSELIDFTNKYCIDINQKETKCILLDKIKTFIDEKVFDIVSETPSNNFNLVILGRTLQEEFDNIFKNYKIDCIIIENQISRIANRMKTIQGMIAQYFIMNNVKTIEFISSMNKLKNFVKKKITYNERKKIGIEITKKLLDINSLFLNNLNLFLKHKKKDDLSDSFLQGIWYINEHKLVDLNLNINN